MEESSKNNVLMSWLMIAMNKKKEEMVELCEENCEENYKQLLSLLSTIKNNNPDLVELTNKIENLFLLKTRTDVEFTYSTVLYEGIEIGKRMR